MRVPEAVTASARVARVSGRFGPVLRDTAVTMVGEAFVLIGGLLLYALFARFFGPIGVGQVALVKRGSGLLQPIVFLGTQTGFPRSIAIAQGEERRTGATIAGGLLVLAASTAIASLVLLGFPRVTSALLLGDARLSFLIPALVVTLVSIIVYGAVRGVLFGMLRIPLANAIQIAAVAVVPVVIVAIAHPTVSTALVLAALGTTLVAAAALLPVIAAPLRRLDAAALRQAISGLVRYSVPRMPGDLMMAALVSVGVLWAARVVDVRTAGYLSVSMSLLSAITAAFVPLSVVLLPRASALIASGRIDVIRPRIIELLQLTVVGSLFVSSQAMIFGDTILRWWLGPAFIEGAPALRAVLAGVPFLAIFFSLRGLIDAAAVRPYHTYNLAVALAVTIAGYAIASVVLPARALTVGIGLSGSLGFALLAGLTVWILTRLYQTRLRLQDFARALLVNVVAILAGLALHAFVAGLSVQGLAAVLAFELVAASLVLGPFVWAALAGQLSRNPSVDSAGRA